MAALETLKPWRCELTAVEIQALGALDPEAIRSFADVIDRRLPKIEPDVE